MADTPLEHADPSGTPSAYFNGFVLGFGNSDFFIRFRLDNSDIVEFKTSFTTAKTLAQNLTEMVKRFEQATDHTLMTNLDVLEALQRLAKTPHVKPDATVEQPSRASNRS